MVFIKKVVMQGFLSYRDETQFSGFDDRINLIVGRNGTGKSNIVNAIRFVLSDQYSNFGKEDRQRILHRGTDEMTMSSYVEIYFDNSDRRFPMDKDEVVIRRTIGVKKDEYFLDKKHVQKSDVINFLEHAGFSRSNRYFIVEQEKVKDIAAMRDTSRYQIIKEVAGVRVYDERREESKKMMHDSLSKKLKIEETLTYIEERLQELESERKELLFYQDLDKQRRALEFSIYDGERRKAIEGLKQVEEKRAKASDQASNLYKQADTTRMELHKAEKELKSSSMNILQLENKREALEKEKRGYEVQKTEIEFNINSIRSNIQAQDQQNVKYRGELKTITKRIESVQAQLDTAQSDYDAAFQSDSEKKEALLNAERRLKELYSKQGRSAQFKNKSERDKFLKKEIENLKKQIESQKKQVGGVQAEISTIEGNVMSIETSIQDQKAASERKTSELDTINRQLEEKKRLRDDLSNKRKELWRNESELDKVIQTSKEELSKLEQQLQSSVNRLISNGLQAVKGIVAEKKITGVHGTLIELFECSSRYFTAIEVAAKNALFHIVVDTDDTAARILEELNKRKGGRVTFIPLNRLTIKPQSYPPTNDDVQPLIGVIKFKQDSRKAFEQIFGKILLCRNLDIAVQYSREYGLDCVTLDGDQVSRKGGLTGGYHDISASRIEIMQNIRDSRANQKGRAEEMTKLKREITSLDQEITVLLGEIQELETRKDGLRAEFEQATLDSRALQRELQLQKEALEKKKQVLSPLEITLRQLEGTKASMETEIESDFVSTLTAEEQKEQANLIQRIEDLKQQILKSTSTLSTVQATKTSLENELYSNLIKRREELEHMLSPLGATQTTDLAELESRLEKFNNYISEIDQQLEQIRGDLAKEKKNVETRREDVEKKKQEEGARNKALQEESESMESILNQRSLYLNQKDEAERKIREIGTIPTNELDKYKDKSHRDLMKILQDTHSNLKKYTNVNKKAIEQYMYFTDKRDELQKRKVELDQAEDSISKLIEHFDNQKKSILELTIRNVAMNFKEVFQELTDGEGKAEIKITGQAKEEKGLALHVRFSAQDTEHALVDGESELSSGQKTLVALAFIFAIQRADPSPFYLFDEIDADLDQKYRQKVASYIEKISKEEQGEKSQFIIISFRPEIARVANKHFLVEMKGKASAISAITKEQSIAFIGDQSTGEETAFGSDLMDTE